MSARGEAAVSNGCLGLRRGLGVGEDDAGGSSIESPSSPLVAVGRDPNNRRGLALALEVGRLVSSSAAKAKAPSDLRGSCRSGSEVGLVEATVSKHILRLP